ncbi:hypothetical protein BDV37DRAFT_55401 [Aspergillus pseudonomiae]|uniref:Uncharacterized protein n=1 Tax=Aspergillus pseudonomiae TaxID=1506151 RepID=A0A5N7CU66_9EURO|nr:uncharacterized protein BDV37DRAFT_55401 [Aspergillus pseudonomiae]KAE8397529.1 hypothetical protein BDV37DRAFT_55401 [Aspergillus pseudonomiae]
MVLHQGKGGNENSLTSKEITTKYKSYTQKNAYDRKGDEERWKKKALLGRSSNRQKLDQGISTSTSRIGHRRSGESPFELTNVERGGRRSKEADGHGSTGELVQQAEDGVNRYRQFRQRYPCRQTSLRSLQELAGG